MYDRSISIVRQRSEYVSGGICMLIGLFVLGCNSPEGREVERQSSPDKRVDAVVVERLTDATVATPIELFLVPTGKEWKKESPVLRGDKFDGLRVTWQQPRYLEIHYKKGRIFAFSNFWSSKDVEEFKHIIELRLAPETESSLPN